MNVQLLYWNKMYRYKYIFCYLSLWLSDIVKLDRAVRIVCAVGSSAAIAAWARWNDFAFVWGLVIAITQVISVIAEFMPYKKRIGELSNMLAQLSAFYIEVEKLWYDVSMGNMNFDEINELTYRYEDKWNSIDSKFFTDDVLPINLKKKEAAEKAAEDYFVSMLGGVING